VLTTYGRSSGFCVDPIEKKPLNHFLPRELGALVRHRRLRSRLPLLPELGHFESRARPTRSQTRRRRRRSRTPRRHSGARASPSPATTRSSSSNARSTSPAPAASAESSRRRHRRIHLPGAAGEALRARGRSEHRSQGLHRTFLCRHLCGTPAAGTGDARVPAARVWFEITTLLIPRPERLRRGDRSADALDRGTTRARRADPLHRLPSRLRAARPAAHTTGDAQAGTTHRARERRSLRLHGQRPRPRRWATATAAAPS
jgi:hypothetical protein